MIPTSLLPVHVQIWCSRSTDKPEFVYSSYRSITLKTVILKPLQVSIFLSRRRRARGPLFSYSGRLGYVGPHRGPVKSTFRRRCRHFPHEPNTQLAVVTVHIRAQHNSNHHDPQVFWARSDLSEPLGPGVPGYATAAPGFVLKRPFSMDPSL